MFLEARAGPQSSATCEAGFEWADSAAQTSPCLLASTVIAACSQTGAWNIPPMQLGSHYNFPDPASGTDTDCYCSWAAYNLLNACTACQNFDDSITIWTPFSANCSSHLSTQTYFPSGPVLAGNASLPFYATIDPTTWQGGKFNVDQAKAIAAEGHPDVNPSISNAASSTSSSASSSASTAASGNSTPTGAIAGGVVGGVVVIAITAFVIFWLLRRRRTASSDSQVAIVKPAHGRSVSDMTQSSYHQTAFSDFNPFASAPPSPPPMGSIHTHESSAQTLSRFGSIYTTPPHGNSPQRTLSPTGSSPSLRTSVTSQNQSNFLPMSVAMHANAEDVIQPFVMNHHNSPSQMNMNRKGGISLMYDSPNSPPVNRADDLLEEDETGTSRPRVNPPAYSPYPAAPPSELTAPSEEVAATLRERNGHSHPVRGEKGSLDSAWNSSGSRGMDSSLTTGPMQNDGSGPSSGQLISPVSTQGRHVVNTAASVISGPDDGPEIA